jgi:hypothetical protein
MEGNCRGLFEVLSPAFAYRLECEGKFIPITGLNRPLGLQKVQSPISFKKSVYEESNVVSLKHQPPLPSSEDS